MACAFLRACARRLHTCARAHIHAFIEQCVLQVHFTSLFSSEKKRASEKKRVCRHASLEIFLGHALPWRACSPASVRVVCMYYFFCACVHLRDACATCHDRVLNHFKSRWLHLGRVRPCASACHAACVRVGRCAVCTEMCACVCMHACGLVCARSMHTTRAVHACMHVSCTYTICVHRVQT